MTEFERIREELEGWSQAEGVSPSVLLQLTEPLRTTLKHLMRKGSMTFGELAEELRLALGETDVIADLLVRCGFLKTSEEGPAGETVYRIRHTRTHRPDAPVAVWRALIGDEGDGGA